MGNYVLRTPGDKCEHCKCGRLERIVVLPSIAESVFCLATLGLGGDGGSQYFKCSGCHSEYNTRYYDENAEEDKPLTWQDYKRMFITFICIGIMVIISYFVVFVLSYSLGLILS